MMNKGLTAAALVGFSTLGVAYAQDNAPRRTNTDQTHAEHGSTSQHSQQAGTIIEEVLVKKLRKGNEGEIELAKLAQQQSSNDAVKKLAQHLITDHQNMNQQLEKVQQTIKQNHPSTGAQNKATTTSGQHMTATVPHEFCQLGEKACELNLKMTKELLTQYKGQDFDMAYLGQQCIAHTMVLAELQAIESDGPEELKQLATEASVKVKDHLQMIKDLSKQLEDDRKAPNS